jgi:hypothetical protein
MLLLVDILDKETLLIEFHCFAAKLPLYLYPFLNNTNKERPHQFIRLASLSVIGALAKVPFWRLSLIFA